MRFQPDEIKRISISGTPSSGGSLADGQIANSKGTIYTCPSGYSATVKLIVCYNTSATAQTVNLYIKRNGSTSRQYAKSVALTQGMSWFPLNYGEEINLSDSDEIEADTTSATSVDYAIYGSTESASGAATSIEGTAVKSTGETGGTKYLREDGDGTCSWQTPAGGGDLLAANNLSDLANAATARSNLGIGNVENTALSTWAGSSNITTLGTILTGTWSGTAIEGTAIASTGEVGGTKFLREDGDGTCSWQTPAGSGDVSKVGTPVDSQIGVWTGDGTIEGDADFTFDTASNTLAIAGVAGTSILAVGGANILVDSPRGTMTLSNIDAIDATTEATFEAAIDSLVNLTTVGTITSGTWQGTAIASAYLGTHTHAISTDISGLGTGVATALAVNVGTAGSFLVNGGALGTPSSGTLTNCTGLPISTGVSGLAANVATFLATPSSANLASAVTDETGSGSLVLATSPTLVTPNLGTPSAIDLTNATNTPPPEGTAVKSTGEVGGTKFLREDGDGTCSWQAVTAGSIEGTAVLSTGEIGGTKYLREDGDGTCSWQAVTGGTVLPKDLMFAPTSMSPLETAAPAWETVDFGTVVATVASFDDTTEEYLNGKFVVPNDVDTAGTVTLEVTCSPKTGAASKNTGWTFGHVAKADGEAVDGTYTEEDSGAKSITATTGNQSIQQWTETVSNLGWAAGDTVYFRLSRDPSVTDDLTGDLYLLEFRISIPMA